MMVRFFLALAAGLLVAAAAAACTHGEGLDPSKIPDNVRADYEIFAHKCSKCHSLARPLTANITDDEQWVLYVNRMRRQPGSGISRDDQEHILRFLMYYAADLRRIEAEKRGGKPGSPGAEPSAPMPPAPTSPLPPPPPAAAPPAAAPPSSADGGSP